MWRLIDIWDWLWYYRRGKIRYHVFSNGRSYNAFASNGNISVWNCYGSTKEQAKEMALFKLKKVMEETKEQELVVTGEGYKLYRGKN